MKIYRAPRTTKKWKGPTDKQDASVLAEKWGPGFVFPMDATIDKGGERHTDIGVELEPDDIVAAVNGLVTRR